MRECAKERERERERGEWCRCWAVGRWPDMLRRVLPLEERGRHIIRRGASTRLAQRCTLGNMCIIWCVGGDSLVNVREGVFVVTVCVCLVCWLSCFQRQHR